MGDITFFDGLNFDYFGITHTSIGRAYHYPDFYSLEYLHAGYLDLTIEHGRCHRLQGPVAFFTDPHYFYDYYSPKGTQRQHYFVCFTGKRAERYRDEGLLQFDMEKPYFPILGQEEFHQGMLTLILSLQNHENYKKSVCLLEQLMLSVHSQQISQRTSGFYLAALEELAQKIMQSPEKPWDLQKEAQALHISYKHFLRIFRNIHGIPPHHFILQQRLFKAKEMLMREQTPVKAIAFACGFQNEFYFSHLFRKYFRQSPRQFRNSC